MAPVVMTSSTRTTQRPRTRSMAVAGPRSERPGDVRRAGLGGPAGTGRWSPASARGPRRRAGRGPRRRPRPAGPPGRSRAARRGRGGRARARAGRHPRRPGPSAGRSAVAERAGQPPLAAYLSWCRASRTTPLNGAHHSSWRRRVGQVRRAGRVGTPARQVEPAHRGRAGRPRRSARPPGRSRRTTPGTRDRAHARRPAR